MGHLRLVLKADQEPALRALRTMARRQFKLELMAESSTVGESHSDGEVENAIQQVQGQARTCKLQLERRLKTSIGMESPLLPWLVRHAAATLNRYRVGVDGFTAYRCPRGRKFSAEVAEFGECVWYYHHRKRDGKLQPR